MKFDSVDKVLDFAIEKEEEAAQLYTRLATEVESPGMRTVFEGFAREEQGHKAKLQTVKKGKSLLPAQGQVLDLGIGDYLVDVEFSPDLNYQQVLILAMKAEKAAFKLYHDLAGAAGDPALKELFLQLAQEEAKHKLRFEIEYDEEILREN